MKRNGKDEVIIYEKVKLRAFEEPWLRFDTEDEKGKKLVCLPIDWITDIKIAAEKGYEE